MRVRSSKRRRRRPAHFPRSEPQASGAFTKLAAIITVLGLTTSAAAELAKAPDPFAIGVERGKPSLGAGYDSALGSTRGEPGACVQDVGTERSEERAVRYSLATLSRAGGRLVVGVHVAVVTATESLVSPRLTDASRRLAQADAAAFRELCGDGYVARTERGGQWLAELEIDRADVARAGAGMTTGTWSDADAFRAALESLTKRYRTIGRELPGGSRAGAAELAPEALVERALGFAETVASESEEPFLAVFAGYEREALSGIVLPGPGELDARETAEQIFRSGQGSPGQSRASRAAEMRLAQVHRDPLETPPAAAAPLEAEPPTAFSVTPPTTPPTVRKQAALVFEAAGGPPVYATTHAPEGVHSDHVRERFYWVPGMAQATPEVARAIESAKTGSPRRGTTVVIVEVGTTVVVMTDAAPAAGIFSQPAGEQRAWIPGVAAPDAAQRAAIAAAIGAEGAAPAARE